MAAGGGKPSAQLLADMAAVLPGGGLLDKAAQTSVFDTDGFTMHRQTPMAVALPQNAEQVRAVIDICRRHNVPIVARGAGTGLSGGALPHPSGVLLALTKMNRILEINADAMLARVQPGVINLAVSQAAAAHNLYYAPDPSSQVACSIGGNIAENAGGVHCLKYGLTVHNVAALKVITINGDILDIGGEVPECPGYDLTALMTGSEGMLGVVVEATLRLLPSPPAVETILAGFDQVEDAAAAVAGVINGGIIPAGLEMMDNPAIRAAEDFAAAGYPVDAAAVLICELDGAPDTVAEEMRHVRDIFTSCNAGSIVAAKNTAERDVIWAGRRAAFSAIGRISPDYYCVDGTIPRRKVAEVLRRIADLAAARGLGVANVFHAGDGNLHPLILYDAAKGQTQQAEALGNDILRACLEAGGTITGEHGVGVEKLDAMCGQFAPPELAQFYRVKEAFDPGKLLNPGKAVPTLTRCAELGGMHIHHNKMPHPHLPRF
ncbi:MAG: FAD-linked oxidase C-terminal domain-containing protein [Gammaproteobacteria bacterium]